MTRNFVKSGADPGGGGLGQDKTMFYLESYTVLCISTLSK